MDRMSAFGAGGACGWVVVEDPNTSARAGVVAAACVENMSLRVTACGAERGTGGYHTHPRLFSPVATQPLPQLLPPLLRPFNKFYSSFHRNSHKLDMHNGDEHARTCARTGSAPSCVVWPPLWKSAHPSASSGPPTVKTFMLSTSVASANMPRLTLNRSKL